MHCIHDTIHYNPFQNTTIMPQRYRFLFQILLVTASITHAWVQWPIASHRALSALHSSAETTTPAPADYDVPEDAVVTIKPKAMKRLQELRQAEGLTADEPLVLRMGVRSGGCSGTSSDAANNTRYESSG